MMWTKLDAKLFQNRKVRKALRQDPMSILLWTALLVGCGHEQTDGFVTIEDVEDAAHTVHADDPDALTKILMAAGLLHDRKGARKCEHCADIAPRIEGFYCHDFADFNPTQDQALIPIEKLRWKRKQALKHDPKLVDAIQARDGDRCCYCDAEVDWNDRRGPLGATYDHLDPNLFEPNFGNTMENVVVACRRENGQKGNRTPEEAGMVLLRDPRGSGQTKSVLGRDQVGTRSDLAATGPHGRAARETERVGSEPGLDLVATRNGHSSNGHGAGTNGAEHA